MKGTPHADNAGVVSRSQRRLEKMMAVIVTACEAFLLTILESKTEIMRLTTRDGGKLSLNVAAAVEFV